MNDRRHYPDTDGTDLDGPDAARFEAVVLAGYILRDHASEILTADDWHVAVTNEQGSPVFRLNVSAGQAC
nr:hypothetical protein [Methylobacterium thuringiense]